MGSENTASKRILTFRQVSEQYPAFTESSLRWLRFNGDNNGFNRCIRKIGRRVFIDADDFESWINNSTITEG